MYQIKKTKHFLEAMMFFAFNKQCILQFMSYITTLTLMVSITCVWLFRTSTALLWLMSSKLTPLAARIWSPILIPFCSARPPGSNLGQWDKRGLKWWTVSVFWSSNTKCVSAAVWIWSCWFNKKQDTETFWVVLRHYLYILEENDPQMSQQ